MAAYGSAAMIASISSIPWEFREKQGSRNPEVSQLERRRRHSHTRAPLRATRGSDCAKTTVFMSSSARGNLIKSHEANVWTNSASESTDFNVKSCSMSSSFWGWRPTNQTGRLRATTTRRPHRDAKPSRPQAPPGAISMPLVVDARLFGPSIFNASKLRVLLPGSGLGSRSEQSDSEHAQDHQEQELDQEGLLQNPRIYTLTHSDVTAKITLTVAREINKAQVMGWYSRFQRDEVVAEWRRTKGEMSLHVHCHVSGTNLLHRIIAKLRFYIFQKELPLVLEAFIHGDRTFFEKHPELLNAPVWVYCHSDVAEYNIVECWGPLVDATKRGIQLASRAVPTTDESAPLKAVKEDVEQQQQQFPGAAVCLIPCECCSRHAAVIPIPESLNMLLLLQTQAMSPTHGDGLPSSTTAAAVVEMIASGEADSSHCNN